MLFSNSLSLVNLVASLLPALLVSATPLSLSGRAGPEVLLQLKGHTPRSDPHTLISFRPVTLSPMVDNFYTVLNGWDGNPATAKLVSRSDYENWGMVSEMVPGLLAFGSDGEANPRYYVIVKDKPLTLFGTRIGGPDPTPEAFNKMSLFPVPGTNYFEVVGGFDGESVQVMRLTGSEYSNLVIQPKSAGLLAYGRVQGEDNMFYAIFKPTYN